MSETPVSTQTLRDTLADIVRAAFIHPTVAEDDHTWANRIAANVADALLDRVLEVCRQRIIDEANHSPAADGWVAVKRLRDELEALRIVSVDGSKAAKRTKQVEA